MIEAGVFGGMPSARFFGERMNAAIDIGSNSIRLLTSDGVKRSVITKLADGIDATGKLSPDGVKATLDALVEFAALCRDCKNVFAFATEAVRRAEDGDSFCAAVKLRTGLTVRVLSGRDEAALALRGAKKPDGAITVCDLGGGSMEIVSAADGKTPEYAQSLPLGVVVLKNKYNGDYRRAIDDAPTLIAGFGEVPAYPLSVMGGSACAIAAGILDLKVYDANRINGAYITACELDDALPMLLSPELATFRPVCAKRADTIPYGAIIIQALINRVGADGFYVSDSGNLEAALAMLDTQSK